MMWQDSPIFYKIGQGATKFDQVGPDLERFYIVWQVPAIFGWVLEFLPGLARYAMGR